MTHCRICGVLEDVGESVICEDCADKKENKSPGINCICKLYVSCEVCKAAQPKRAREGI